MKKKTKSLMFMFIEKKWLKWKCFICFAETEIYWRQSWPTCTYSPKYLKANISMSFYLFQMRWERLQFILRLCLRINHNLASELIHFLIKVSVRILIASFLIFFYESWFKFVLSICLFKVNYESFWNIISKTFVSGIKENKTL